MAKELEQIIKEAKQLVDILLVGKTELSDISENTKSDLNINIPNEVMEEHKDNYIPDVPDEGKTPGKDIKKAIVNPTNLKVKQPIETQNVKIDNELPDGVTPDPVKISVEKMKKDINEAIQNILSKSK